MPMPNGQWNQSGIQLFMGAFCGFIATLPWLVACVGWAAHWNVYINMSLTVGGAVLWFVLWKTARDAPSNFDYMDDDDLREMIFSLSKTLGKP